jgi:glycosyltransferase involved in cell wall biosynthesis
MKLLLVADVFPPARISGAIQLRDLAQELVRQGHDVLVLVPGQQLAGGWRVEVVEGATVLRVRAPRTKDVGLVRRALAEAVLPFALLAGLARSPFWREPCQGIVWYSPTIFLGPLVFWLKRRWACPAYLILRDLFPDWAVDAGVMKRGWAYAFFKAVERFQYRQADVIGVQSPSNEALVARDAGAVARIEVLHNWQSSSPVRQQGAIPRALEEWIDRRIVFIHAGNMGVAQDLDVFLDAVRRLSDRDDFGLLLIGRGSERERLRTASAALGGVVRVEDEIPESLLLQVLERCHVGVVSLNPGHRSHNIPGKFLTYVRSGLPVLACVNSGNDLTGLVESEGCGIAVAGADPVALSSAFRRLIEDSVGRSEMGGRGARLARRLFTADRAARQIVDSLG